MLKDITLGQFFPGNSPLHRLDPRSKILSVILLIVAVFLAENLASFVFLSLLTLLLTAVSRISLRTVMKGLKAVIFVILLTSVLNLFFTKGQGEPLASFWVFRIYTEGIWHASFMLVRIVCLIILTSVVLTYTTSPIDLTDGIERLLSPLKYIKVPVHEFAMMMTIAMRFIPTLVEETDKNHERAEGKRRGFCRRRAYKACPCAVSGSDPAVHFGDTAGSGAGGRYGMPLLSRRKRQNQNEDHAPAGMGYRLSFAECADHRRHSFAEPFCSLRLSALSLIKGKVRGIPGRSGNVKYGE